MQIGDLIKTSEGAYGIITGFWEGDVSGTNFIQVYLNGDFTWLHPGTLEAV